MIQKRNLRTRNMILGLVAASAIALLPAVGAHAADGTVSVLCTVGSFDVETSGSDVVVKNGLSCEGTAVIPASVTSIDYESFYPGEGQQGVPRTNLTGVVFEANSQLASIGDRAFRGANLNEIEFPDSLKSIGQEAFTDVPLTSVKFGSNSGLEHIGEAAFQRNLFTTFVVPATVTSFGEFPFSGNQNLTSFIFPENSMATAIPPQMFESCPSLKLVKLSGQITSIGSNAFSGTPALKDLVIPASVTSIDSGALPASGEDTRNFYFLGAKPTTLGNQVFSGSDENTANIYVPTPVNGDSRGWDAPFWVELDPDTSEERRYATIRAGFYVVDLKAFSDVESDRSYGGAAVMDAPASPTLEGYRFRGWSEIEGGPSVVFPYSPARDVITVLYANFVLPSREVETPQNHFVTFDPNGAPGNRWTIGRNSAAPLATNGFTQHGYLFTGWNTKADGSGVGFSDKASYAFNSDLVLYAQWSLASGKKLIKTFAINKATLTTSMKIAVSRWVSSLPRDSAIMCQGSTSGSKATALDKKLASNRAKNVCAYAARVRKDLTYKVTVKPSASTSSAARNVWMSYN